MVAVRYIVDDVERAIAFYRDLLGFALDAHPAPGFAALSRGDLRLLLNAPGAGGAGQAGGSPRPGGWARVQLRLDDLDAAVERLRASGAAFRGGVVGGMGGRQILLEDPSGNPIELFEAGGAGGAGAARRERDRSEPPVRATVLLHGERTGGRVSATEIVVPPRDAGPPLHRHDFDEAFYVLEGELVFQLGATVETRRTGELFLAPRNAAHALANRTDAPARYVLVCAPAGFERHWARLSADVAGVEPPAWAIQPIPEVTVVGPPIAAPAARSASG